MARTQREMFDTKEKGEKTLTFEDPGDIYDTFYAGIYDKLFTTPERLSFEKSALESYALSAWPISETKILDACCGTSPHAEWLCKKNVELVGLDSSESMLQKARAKCSSARFYRGDITRAETFPPKSFSHAMLLYFSIYQFHNPKMICDTIYSWLKPGGVFVVHLVNPHKFDPILDAASPFAAFSLQKYSDERIIESDIVFDQFSYKSRFVKDGDDATFEEVVTFYDPKKHDDYKYRENKHRLYMPSLDAMTDIIKASGFTQHEMVDMTPAGYEYQYLIFFTK
jgi:ubiquinone/menaquinone biosynthesis C-methylase UbiE